MNKVVNEQIVMCNKFPCGEETLQYFIEMKCGIIEPLCIKIPQMKEHAKSFDETKLILFLI